MLPVGPEVGPHLFEARREPCPVLQRGFPSKKQLAALDSWSPSENLCWQHRASNCSVSLSACCFSLSVPYLSYVCHYFCFSACLVVCTPSPSLPCFLPPLFLASTSFMWPNLQTCDGWEATPFLWEMETKRRTTIDNQHFWTSPQKQHTHTHTHLLK